MLITAVTMAVSSGDGGDLADERLVDLEGIDGKLSQIAQAGVTRAEIIDRHLHPSGSQCLQDRCSGLGMLHQNAFRQLQLKRSRIAGPFPSELRIHLPESSRCGTPWRRCLPPSSQRQACIHPGPGLLARFTKDPFADRQNQAAVFRDGNKLCRRELALAWDASSVSTLPRR